MAGTLNRFICLIAGLMATVAVAGDNQRGSNDIGQAPNRQGPTELPLSNVAMFQKLFHFKRSEQKAAIQRILELDSAEKQAKLVELIVSKIMEVLITSLKKLESVGHIPGAEFPEDESVRDALSSLLENTAFLGDLLLYLPDVSQPLLKKNNEWNQLFLWSLTFSRETSYLDKTTKTLLYLVAQEMNLVVRELNYVNPYARANRLRPTEAPKPPTKKPRKKISKGPSLSGRRQDL